MKDLGRKAEQGRVTGTAGPRDPRSLWNVRAIRPAVVDGKRLFRGLRPDALAIAIDLRFKKLESECFYRLRIDDRTFGSRSLRVFFWPQRHAGIGGDSDSTGTIWILGLTWRNEATYGKSMRARIRRRQKEVVNQS